MADEQLRALAHQMAKMANDCCSRTDGWEEYLAEQFYQMMKEAQNV